MLTFYNHLLGNDGIEAAPSVAHALTRAVQQLLRYSRGLEDRPSLWAAFVLVGLGRVQR